MADENLIDRAEAIRAGEELPAAALAAYLSDVVPGLAGELVVRQFPRGYSNLTYLIQMGGRELVLRRPPFGANIASAHDMGREYRVLRGLEKVYNATPRPLVYCEDDTIIGAPFYVMERVRGLVLRAERMDEVHLSSEQMAGLARTTIENLSIIHGLDYKAAGLDTLGRSAGYVGRQIHGWIKRYRAVQTEDLPAVEAAMSWLEKEMPVESGAAIIHNDYKYDNLILDLKDPTRILAVLDWEMCTLGDPLMDLGTTLGYWIEAGDPPAMAQMFGLTTLPGNPTRQQVVALYTEASGRDVSSVLYYYVYGLFKIAVILQQIYARYIQGHSGDARFAALHEVVASYGELMDRALSGQRISNL